MAASQGRAGTAWPSLAAEQSALKLPRRVRDPLGGAVPLPGPEKDPPGAREPGPGTGQGAVQSWIASNANLWEEVEHYSHCRGRMGCRTRNLTLAPTAVSQLRPCGGCFMLWRQGHSDPRSAAGCCRLQDRVQKGSPRGCCPAPGAQWEMSPLQISSEPHLGALLADYSREFSTSLH